MLLLCVQADMYYLKQRQDVQQLFDLPPEGAEGEGQQEQEPWKHKNRAQLDAEVAERAAQLAAAAAGKPWPPSQQTEAQQEWQPAGVTAGESKQPAKTWWSVWFRS
jgi:hypothetical protein